MSREALGTAMRTRREELGLTVVDAVARAGVARSTWRELEAGSRTRLTASVAVGIDTALGWRQGTSAAIFRGEIDTWNADDDAVAMRGTEEMIARIIEAQMTAIRERLSTLETERTWADEVLDAFQRASPEWRAICLRILRQAAQS